jgi:RNA polymerase sigma factor (sigma-70 family)
MTELLHPVDAPSDAELISRVRGGDLDAYGLLYERHVEAARRLSRQLVRGPDADDLVSEAFAKVMTVLQGGGGPDIAFRAYLLTAVRRLHVDRVRAQSRVTTSDDLTPFDPGVPFQDTAVEKFESGAAAKAFASLPERWQLVLWHLEVEGQKPAEIAAILGMSPNSVSALAYRAREGLRQAFLSAHLADTAEANCRWVTEHLGAYVRHGLAKRDAAKVEDHLKDCRGCTAMFLELTEVNSNLAGIIAPLLLGSLAAGYVASAGGSAAAAGGALAVVGRVRDFVVSNAVPVAAGTAAATVAVATAIAVTVTGGDSPVAGPGVTPPSSSTSVESSAPATSDKEPKARKSVVPVQRSARPFETSTAVPVLASTTPTVLPSETLLASTAASDAPTDSPADAPTDGPTDGPTNAPGDPEADVGVADATISDDSLVVEVRNLPQDALSITVRLSSDSGRVQFKARKGTCTVDKDSPTVARCVTTNAAARMAVLAAAPSDFQAVIPIDFPADLAEDRLSVEVSVDGYRDTKPEDNTFSFDYKPDRGTSTATPTDDPTSTDTSTPTDTATPTDDPSPTDTATPTDDPSPTDTSTPTDTATPTDDPSPTDTATPTDDPSPTDTSTPTDTATPTEPPGTTYDLGIDLTRNGIGHGIGRFRVQVTGLPTSGTRPSVHLAMSFDDPKVDLEGIPGECSYTDGGHRDVSCTTTGASWNGIFDADLRYTDLSVRATVRVSMPGNNDPDGRNDVRSLTLGVD